MTEEIQPGGKFRKAISQERDGLQSRLLVAVVGTLLVVLCISAIKWAIPEARQFPSFILGGAGVSLTFALVVWLLKSATTAGAGLGGIICLLLIYGTGLHAESITRTALTPLAALFAFTFLSTRAGRTKKAKAGLAEGRRGRSASQVIANLSVAALSVSPLGETLILGRHTYSGAGYYTNWVVPAMYVMCLTALTEATADTVSSEIGQAFGGTPRMLLTLRRVEPGTDGAITALGTAAGILAGVLVAAAGTWAMHLHWQALTVVSAAGISGLFFDSLLGATVERKDWLGNDLVNFASTVFAALVAAVMYCHLVL